MTPLQLDSRLVLVCFFLLTRPTDGRRKKFPFPCEFPRRNERGMSRRRPSMYDIYTWKGFSKAEVHERSQGIRGRRTKYHFIADIPCVCPLLRRTSDDGSTVGRTFIMSSICRSLSLICRSSRIRQLSFRRPGPPTMAATRRRSRARASARSHGAFLFPYQPCCSLCNYKPTNQV